MKTREIIPNSGPAADNLLIGLNKVLRKATAEKKGITIIVPDFGSIEGVISDTYGKDFIKAIKINKPVTFEGQTISINVVSDRTMKSNNVNQIAYCIYVTAKMLEKINDFYNVTDEIVIPWMQDDIDLYKKLWKL